MTEDELLAGITEALELAGWTWTHIIRSDRVTQGHGGLPDIIALHPRHDVLLLWELKRQDGQLTPDQWRWILAGQQVRGTVDARVIRPAAYDRALAVILRGIHPRLAFADDVVIQPASASDVTFDRRA